MSIDDFDRCTPAEFRAIMERKAKEDEKTLRREWEIARMECLCMTQPYASKRLSAKDIMEFPWDGEAEEKREPVSRAADHWEEVKRQRGIQ